VAKVYIKADMIKKCYGAKNGLQRLAGQTLKRRVVFTEKDQILGSPLRKKGNSEGLKADIPMPKSYFSSKLSKS